MNEHRCFCDLAPLYALDLLAPEERLWVEAQVIALPDLAEELANCQAAVAAIPYSAPKEPIAADLKQRLFDRLDLGRVETNAAAQPAERVEADSITQPEIQSVAAESSMVVIRPAQLEWQTYQTAGVEIAILFLDPTNRMCSAIVKAADGIVYPLHQHRGIEEIYMLEGDLEIGGRVYLAGDYIRSYPDSIHPPATTRGCKFFIRACIDDNYDQNLVTRSIDR